MDQNAEPVKEETSTAETPKEPTDVRKIFIEKFMSVKNDVDVLDREIRRRETEITKLSTEVKAFTEERLKLQGAYQHLVNLGLQLGFIALDAPEKN